MQTKRSKVLPLWQKSPVQNVWLSSEYGYCIYSITNFKGITIHIFLKFYKFYRIAFHFPVYSFLFLSSLRLMVFSSLYTFMMDFKKALKLRTLELLETKTYYLKSNERWFRNTLSSALGKMTLYDNTGTRRFLLKHSITVHHNRLGLELWTKRWITVSSSKLQNEQTEVLCLRYKKSSPLRYRVLCNILYWKYLHVESIVVIVDEYKYASAAKPNLEIYSQSTFARLM